MQHGHMLVDYPRIYGGKKKYKKSPPLPIGEGASRDQMKKNGTINRHSAAGLNKLRSVHKALPTVNSHPCIARYYELVPSIKTHEPIKTKVVISPKPKMIYVLLRGSTEIASFTDIFEAFTNAMSMNAFLETKDYQVFAYERGTPK